jgi:hypothetical protein
VGSRIDNTLERLGSCALALLLVRNVQTNASSPML